MPEHRRGATFGALIGAFDTGIGTGSIAIGWMSERYGFSRAFAVAGDPRRAVGPVLPVYGEAPMDYVRLGSTGLKVSRLCLGTMTYGTPAWRPWVLDEATSRPFIKRALEHGINFFDTADMYSRGVSEEVVGRALKDFAKRDEVVHRDQSVLPGRRRTPTAADCRASTSCRRSTPRCAGWAWTTSISIRSTASTITRRSRRRSKRCTTS